MNEKELYAVIGEQTVKIKQYESLIQMLQQKQQSQTSELNRLKESNQELESKIKGLADKNSHSVSTTQLKDVIN